MLDIPERGRRLKDCNLIRRSDGISKISGSYTRNRFILDPSFLSHHSPYQSTIWLKQSELNL